MYMNRNFVRKNITTCSIILFLIIFTLIQISSPIFLYTENGLIRQFGLGKKNKTILPIWFITLILSFLSYLAVLYYVNVKRIY